MILGTETEKKQEMKKVFRWFNRLPRQVQMNVDRVEKNLGKMIKLVKEKNQYRNQFRNKYYEYYNKMKRLKNQLYIA